MPNLTELSLSPNAELPEPEDMCGPAHLDEAPPSATRATPALREGVEWPTLALFAGCYLGWVLGTVWLAEIWLPLAAVVVILTTALHSSLTHEVLHGHPFRSCFWNAMLVFPALCLVVPYLRFKDTHLAHHRESRLTDPYDDPETNYQDPAIWSRLPSWKKQVFRLNNTLAGRLLLGPALGTWAFCKQDWQRIHDGDRRVALGWALHVPAVAVVVWWMLSVAAMPLWLWALCVYAALAILKIRTFLEHRAHQDSAGRTVVIEDRGLLALLFLNNNLHSVHHMYACVAWYDLPRLYYANRARFLKRNDGYVYRSYAEVFRRYLWTAKDPVPHPLWSAPED